jgi:hypothetical protein
MHLVDGQYTEGEHEQREVGERAERDCRDGDSGAESPRAGCE